MAGESWKSHKNSALERDMDADHDAQFSEWTTAPGLGYLPAEIERHEMDQLREYDAAGTGTATSFRRGSPARRRSCGRSATGTPGMSTRR